MSLLIRILPPVIAVAVLLPVRSAAGAAEPSDEVVAAFAKLHESSYRRRDRVDAVVPMAGIPGLPPMVTECAAGVERIVYEIEAPGVGKIQTVQVRIGERSAMRIVAPGLMAKIETARRDLTVNAAKSLLRQIVSVATAIQTGGLSTASWVQEAIRAAATITTTAQARVALDAALKNFDGWQLVPVNDDDEGNPALAVPNPGDADMYGSVEKSRGTEAGTIRYTRRPPMAVPGADLTNVVVVSTATGLPLSEENYLNGKRIMRTEYFDVGAPLTIDVPECLKWN